MARNRLSIDRLVGRSILVPEELLVAHLSGGEPGINEDGEDSGPELMVHHSPSGRGLMEEESGVGEGFTFVSWKLWHIHFSRSADIRDGNVQVWLRTIKAFSLWEGL